jgi:hypothetical protein
MDDWITNDGAAAGSENTYKPFVMGLQAAWLGL